MGRVRWELRLRAAERGVFKAVEMRRLLAEAGLEISAGKMSALWSATVAPVSVRLDDLQVLCRVLGCDAAGLLVLDPPAGRAAGLLPTAGGAGPWAGGEPTSGAAGLGEGPGGGGVVRPSLPPV